MYYVQHNCKHTIHSRIDRTQLRGLSAGREAKPCKHALLLHKLVWGKQKKLFHSNQADPYTTGSNGGDARCQRATALMPNRRRRAIRPASHF